MEIALLFSRWQEKTSKRGNRIMEDPSPVSPLRRAQVGELSYAVGDLVVSHEAAGLAERVIDGLPEERELTFYDKSYPSPGDPGAYVAVRTFAGKYFYRLANYGWTGRWKRETKENLVQLLDRSLPGNDFLTLRACVAGKPIFFGWLSPR